MAVPTSSLQYDAHDDVGIRAAAAREARDTRKAQRAAAAQKNGNGVPRGGAASHQPQPNGHYVPESQQSSPRRDSFVPDDDPGSPYASDGVVHEAVMVPQQQQQRSSRGSGQRGSAEQSSMPPVYPGPPMEDAPRSRQSGGHRRQPSNGQSSGPPEAYGNSRRVGGPESLPSQNNRRSRNLPGDLQPPPSQQQQQQQQQRRQQSHPATAEATQAGPSSQASRISRLESPSVIKSVLQPLEKKLSEYDQLMSEASTEMTLLDDEIRALQTRRQQAEDRFLGAKAKHDDYARQHDDVERAMRGEWPPMDHPSNQRNVAFAPTPVMTPQQQQLQQALPPPLPPFGRDRDHDAESIDERPMSRDSEFSHGNKPRTRDRLRFSSLFSR